MNKHELNEVLRCPTCNNKMEFLNHEKTVAPMIEEMAPIGVNKTVKVVNIQMYCDNCRVNTSKQFQYVDEKFVPKFIGDVQGHSAHFENPEYMAV